ncbi:MAG: DUF11 domain-containing protein [Verrucomicrobia bacterium]|nr:DUF11 domain-containing protein [Verrucomicrobiota bacterium]
MNRRLPARSVRTCAANRRGACPVPIRLALALLAAASPAPPLRADILPVPVHVTAADTVPFSELATRAASSPRPAGKYAASAAAESDGALPPEDGQAAPARVASAPAPLQELESPMPNANFAALLDDGTAFTPDIAAAVGVQHLMVALNSQVRIQDRQGHALSTVTLDGFWAGLTNAVLTNLFCSEPRLLFDPHAQRWIFTANANLGTNNAGVLLAVSGTPDPTGTWHRRFIATTNVVVTPATPPATNTIELYAERPTPAFNKDWIVVQANLYYRTDDTLWASAVYVFNKTNLYAGGTLSPLRFEFVDPVEGLLDINHVPAAAYDAAASSLYFVQVWAGNYQEYGYLRIYSLEHSPTNTPFLKTTDATGDPGPFAETWYAWDSGPPAGVTNLAPQWNSPHRIDAGDDRIQNVVYRRGLLYAVHTVFLPTNAPTHTALQWYVITPGLGESLVTRFDAGVADPEGRSFAFPSIAVNRDDDILVGYTRFDSNHYPCAGYVFQGRKDPPETQRGDIIYRYGEAPYYVPDCYGVNLWGAYSASITDPVNDTDLWTVQQYAELPAPQGSRWGTWWARVSPDVDLALAASVAPDPVYAGNPLTCTLTVTNLEPNRASGVVLSNRLPPGAVFVSGTVPGGACALTNDSVICDLGMLDTGQSRAATIVILPFTQGLMSNAVSVAANGRDLNPTNNTATSVTTVLESADLALLGSDDPDPVGVGQDLVYALTVTNQGPFASVGVWLTNILPSGVTLVSSVASQGACTLSGTTLKCSLGPINSNRTATVTLVLRPTTAGTLTHRARVAAGTFDYNPANNSVTNTTRAHHLPTLSAIGPRTMSEDTVLGPLAFTVSDAETPAASLTVTAASSNPALVSPEGLGLGGSGPSRTLTLTPLPDQFGTATITLTVADLDQGIATHSFLLTVTNVNDPPSINSLPDQTILEDMPMPVTLLMLADLETPVDSLFLAATSTNTTLVPPTNIAFLGTGASRILSVKPAPNQHGTARITVTVADGGLEVSTSFVLTVLPVNDPPFVTVNTNLTLDEDTSTGPLPLTLSDDDTPASNLVVHIRSSLPWLVGTSEIVLAGTGTNRTLTLTPVPNEAWWEPAQITLAVSDATPLTNTVILFVTVNPVDDPPTLNPIPPRSLTEDDPLQTVPLGGIGTGAWNEDQTLTVTAVSGNTRVVPAVHVDYSSPNPTGTLSFTPLPDASGIAAITVTVADGGLAGNTVVRTFNVIVTPVNDAPTLDPLGELDVLEDSGVIRLPLSGVSTGATNEFQTLVVTTASSAPAIVPPPTVSYVSPNPSGQLNVSPATNAAGTAVLTVTVNDGGSSNNLVTRSFPVTVRPVNDPPTIHPVGDRTVSEDFGDYQVELAGLSGGPPDESQALTLTALSDKPNLVSHPVVLYTNPAATAILRFTSLTNQAGLATLTLTLQDDGASNSITTHTFTLAVNPVNDPPTLNPIGPFSIDEDSGGLNVPFAGVSSGAPNEKQELTVTALSSNPAILPHPAVTYTSPNPGGSLHLRPLTNAFGNVTITVTVRDDGSGTHSTSRSFEVNVRSVNDPPAISQVPDATLLEDGVTDPLPFTVSDVETAPAGLTLSADSSNQELVSRDDIVLAGTGVQRSVTVRPRPNQFGSAQISLIVFDADGGYAITEFGVNVQSVNDPPWTAPVPDQTMREDGVLSGVPLTVLDDDVPASPFTLTATASNLILLPPGSLVLGGTGTNRTLRIQPAPGKYGEATIVVGVNDGITNVTRAFTLTVLPNNRSPVMTALGPQTTAEDLPLGPLAFDIGDRETPAGDLRLTASSSNPDLIPAAGIVFGGSGSNRTVTLHPVTNQFGTAFVTLGVEDAHFVWTPVPMVPTVESNRQCVLWPASEPLEVFRLTGIESAPPPPPLRIEPAGPHVKISWPHPAPDCVLERALHVAGRARVTFLLTVTPVNDAPLISIVPDAVIPEDGSTGDLPFTLEDVESPVTNLVLTVASSDPGLVPAGGLVLGGTGTHRTVRVTPAADRFGAATVTLTARDPQGAQSTRAFTVTVFSVNEPPTLHPPADVVLDEDAGPQNVILTGISSGEPSEVQTLAVSAESSDPVLLPSLTIAYTSAHTNGILTFGPRANAFGSATITVTVNDGGLSNNLVRRTFTVTVRSINDLPALAGIPNQILLEDTSTPALPFAVSDVETAADALAVTATASPPGLVPGAGLVLQGTGTNRTLVVTPAPDQHGTAMITLRAADADQGETTASFTLTVLPVNDPPTLDPIPDLQRDEDDGLQTVSLTGLSVGAPNEPDTLTVSVENDNPALLTDLVASYTSPDPSGTLRFRTVTNAHGTATLTVRVNDGGASNQLVSQTFTVVVRSVNDLPILSALGPQTTDEDVPAGPLAFTVGDVETGAASLIVSGASSNPALVPLSGLSFAGTGSNRTLVVRAATNQFGTATLTLKVADADRGESTTAFQLTVNSVNDPPVITSLPPQTTDEDLTLMVPFVVGDVETPAGALRVGITNTDPGLLPDAQLVLAGTNSSRTLAITPAFNRHGTATLTLSVQDEGGAMTETRFAVTVRPVNDPPTLDPLSDLTLDEDSPAQTVALSGISSGASDEVQTLVLSAATAQPWLVTNLGVTHTHPATTATLRFEPVPNADQPAVITVSVDDGGASNNVIQRSFTVNLRPVNDPPAIAPIAPQLTSEDLPAGPIAFTAADLETAPAALTLSVSSSNPTLVNSQSAVFGGDGTNRTLTLTPLRDQSGKATLTLIVTDAGLATASTTFDLVVLPVNDPPAIAGLHDLSIPEDNPPADIAFTVADIEFPGAQLLVLATSSNPTLLPPAGVTVGGAGTNRTLRLAPAANQYGMATVTVTATDPDGATGTAHFDFTVTPVNNTPVVSGIPPQTVLEDTPNGPLTWLADDRETAGGALSIVASSSNPALVAPGNIAVSGTGALRTVVVTPMPNQSGAATITLTANDGQNGIAQTRFPITVTPVNDPPSLDPLPNLTVPANSGPQTVPLSGISPGAPDESQTLAITALSSQPNLVPQPALQYSPGNTTGSLTFAPVAGASGTATITVTVDDGGDGLSTVVRAFTVTVTAVSGPPSLSNLADQTLLEDTLLALPFSVGDSETDPLRLTVTAASSNPALLPLTHIAFQGAGADRWVLLQPASNAWGAATVTLTVSDGVNTASDAFDVTVVPVNDPPAVTPVNDVLRSEGFSLFSVGFIGVSPGAPNEPQTNTITATSSNPSLVAVDSVVHTPGASSGTVRLNKGTTPIGIAEITLRLDDGGASNNVVLSSFLVYVKPTTNTLPTLFGLTARTIAEDTSTGPLAFTINDTDTPPDQLTLTAESFDPTLFPPANIVLGGSGTNRTLTVTPAPNRHGSNIVRITIVDSTCGLRYANVPITVTPVNDRPTLSAITNQTATSGIPSSLIPFTVTDLETHPDQLAVTATSAHPALVPQANIVLGGSGTNRALRITPAAGQTGNATLTVTARDGTLGSTQTFVLTVTAPNTPPTLSDIADQTTATGTPTPALAFTIADAETPAADLTLSAACSNPLLIPTRQIVFGGSGNARTVTVTPVAGQIGTANITITVSDAGGATASDSFLVTVSALNHAPTLAPLANLNLTPNAGPQTVSLTGIGVGSSDQNQTLFIVASSGNPALVPHPAVTYTSPDPAGTLVLHPVPGASGIAVITVTVNDSQPQNTTATRTFTVRVNGAPTLAITPLLIVDEDTAVPAIPFTLGDPESPLASLQVSATSSNPALLPDTRLVLAGTGASRTLSVTPLPDQFGSTFVRLVVADDTGLACTNGVYLFVRSVDDLPTLDPISAQVAYLDVGTLTVPLTGCSAGPAELGQVLRLHASSDNPAVVPHPSVLYTSPQPAGQLILTPAAQGTATITVTADDGDLLSHAITRAFTVTVTTTPVRLTLRRDASTVVVSWPYPAPGYILERSYAHTSPWTWAAVPDAAAVSGNQQSVTLPATGRMELYRLRKSVP